jgi:hypothetical protein
MKLIRLACLIIAMPQNVRDGLTAMKGRNCPENITIPVILANEMLIAARP